MPEPIAVCPSNACTPPTEEAGPVATEAARPHEQGGASPPGEPDEPDGLGAGTVWLCRRVADPPLANTFPVEHWWLMTSEREAGLGPCGGGVPDSHTASPYATETCVNDQRGEHSREGAECEPIAYVDAGCVDRELTLGRPLGPLTPLNQCLSFAEDVLDGCKADEIETH